MASAMIPPRRRSVRAAGTATGSDGTATSSTPSTITPSTSTTPNAHAEDPNVAYLKATLTTTALAGVPPGDYYLKWSGGGGPAKSKKSRPAAIPPSGSGPFHVSIPMYTKARRASPTSPIVAASTDPADSLDTTLTLCRARDDSIVAQTAVDIGDFLALATTKSVTMAGGIKLEMSVTAKTIGDTKLPGLALPRSVSDDIPTTSTPTQPPLLPSAQSSPQTSLLPSTIAVDTAAKLERLRSDVADRSNQIEALKQQTTAIDDALQAKASLTPNSNTTNTELVSDLRARVRELEVERAALEKEKADAENKIKAHVQHAAKIKTTYNQLAAWYNNLRTEHAELQKKHPESSSTETSRDVGSETVKSTHEEDLRILEKERDELQQLLAEERKEKLDLKNRSNALLDEKVASLAELQQQLNEKSRELERAKAEADKAAAAPTSARFLIAEREEQEKLRAEIISLKQSHDHEAATLRSKLVAEQARMDDEIRKSADEKSRLEADVKALRAAVDAAALREAEADTRILKSRSELESLKAELEDVKQVKDRSASLNRDERDIDRSAVESLKAKLTLAESEVETAKAAANLKEREAEDLQYVADKLRAELDETRAHLEQVEAKTSSSASGVSASYVEDTKVESLTAERDHAIRELFRVRKAMNAEIRALKKERDALTESSTQTDGSANGAVVAADRAELERLEHRCKEAELALGSEKERFEKETVKLAAASEEEKRMLLSRIALLESEVESAKMEKNRFDALHREQASESAKLAKADDLVASLNAKIADLEARFESSSADHQSYVHNAEVSAENARAGHEQLRSELERVQFNAKQSTQRLNELEEELTMSHQLIDELKSTVSAVESARDRKSDELSSVSVELAFLKKSMDAASTSTSSVEQQLSDARKEIADAHAENRTLSIEIEKLRTSSSAELEAERSSREAVKNQLVELQSELDVLKSGSGSSKMEMLSADLSLKESTIRDLTAEVAELRSSVELSQQKHHAATDQLKALRSEKEAVEAKLAAARTMQGKHEKDSGHGSRETVQALKAELATMQRVAVERNREFENLTTLLKQMKASHEQAAADYDALFEQHSTLKHELENRKAEENLRIDSEKSSRNPAELEEELDRAKESIRKLTDENQDLAVAVEELREMLTREEQENRINSEIKRDLRSSRSKMERLEAELASVKGEKQLLQTRVETLGKLEEGSADALVDELIRCKLDLANAWEQLDHYKQRVKQLSPEHHVSPNTSGNKPSSNSFERRGTKK